MLAARANGTLRVGEGGPVDVLAPTIGVPVVGASAYLYGSKADGEVATTGLRRDVSRAPLVHRRLAERGT
jgi:hypothetical protein